MGKVTSVFLRSPYNYDRAEASQLAAEAVGDYGESLTVQSMAEDADINVIVKRFGITGKLPENVRLPQYGDFTGVGDYRSALEAVRAADEEFLKIPAEIRARFLNDPQNFLAFCSDPGNLPELRKMGLAKEVGDGSVAVDGGIGGGHTGAASAAGGVGAADSGAARGGRADAGGGAPAKS